MMKGKKLNKNDFTKEGLKKLINRDIEEINSLSDKDLISLWSFFKFICSLDISDTNIFLTSKNSIVASHKEEIERINSSIEIKLGLEEINLGG